MYKPMVPCPGCHRHVREEDRGCPFCGSSLAGASAPSFDTSAAPMRVVHMALAVGALALSGCPRNAPGPDPDNHRAVAPVYGAPPPMPTPPPPTPPPAMNGDSGTPSRTNPNAPAVPPSDPGGGAEIYGAPPPQAVPAPTPPSPPSTPPSPPTVPRQSTRNPGPSDRGTVHALYGVPSDPQKG